jgi:hypothetical protein
MVALAGVTLMDVRVAGVTSTGADADIPVRRAVTVVVPGRFAVTRPGAFPKDATAGFAELHETCSDTSWREPSACTLVALSRALEPAAMLIRGGPISIEATEGVDSLANWKPPDSCESPQPLMSIAMQASKAGSAIAVKPLRMVESPGCAINDAAMLTAAARRSVTCLSLQSTPAFPGAGPRVSKLAYRGRS